MKFLILSHKLNKKRSKNWKNIKSKLLGWITKLGFEKSINLPYLRIHQEGNE